MKINSLSIRNYVNFNAKHKDTRKADDLMRNANLAFPMFNPSYAYYFYNTINGESKEKQIARENDLQRLFKFVWYGTNYKFDAEPLVSIIILNRKVRIILILTILVESNSYIIN